MTSFVRRGGARLLSVISSVDPVPEVGRSLIYAKTVFGVTQAFKCAPDGTIYQITPGTAYRYRGITASEPMLVTDEILVVAGAGAPVAIDLPLANTMPAGQRFLIQDGDGQAALFPITVAGTGGDLVNGLASQAIVTPYGTLEIVSDGVSRWNAITGAAAAGTSGPESMFYGLTAGTGNPGASDYAATIAADTAIPFPRAGATSGGTIAPGGLDQFVLPDTGVYAVSWTIAFLEPSQLILKLGTTELPETATLSGAGTQENTNTVLISAQAGDLLSLCNASGNTPALTVQTADGARTHAQAPSLVIRQVLPPPGAPPVPTYREMSTGDFVLTTDQVVALDSTAGGFLVTMPLASSVPPGHRVLLADRTGQCQPNGIKVTVGGGSDTILGQTTVVIEFSYGYLDLVSDGVDRWFGPAKLVP